MLKVPCLSSVHAVVCGVLCHFDTATSDYLIIPVSNIVSMCDIHPSLVGCPSVLLLAIHGLRVPQKFIHTRGIHKKCPYLAHCSTGNLFISPHFISGWTWICHCDKQLLMKNMSDWRHFVSVSWTYDHCKGNLYAGKDSLCFKMSYYLAYPIAVLLGWEFSGS